jgi:hypothetical protein
LLLEVAVEAETKAVAVVQGVLSLALSRAVLALKPLQLALVVLEEILVVLMLDIQDQAQL